MKIEYDATRKDMMAAYLAHRNRRTIYAVLNFFVFRFVPCATVISLILFIVMALYGNINPWLVQLLPVMVVLTVAAFIDRHSTPRRFLRSMFPASVSDRRVVIEVNDEKVVSSIPGATRFEYLWGSISLFLCDAQVNLLYISPGRFILIPNRVLTTEEKASLDEIIARKGIKRKSC
ncbi:MAG: hypothetical protein ABSC77_04000 [Terracidiphilus sp.]|jgi:hypothetical protein